MKGHESYALVVFEQMPFSSPLAHTLFGMFFSFLEHHLYFYYFVMFPWYKSLSGDTKHGNQKCPTPCPILGFLLVILRHGEGGQAHLMHIELWGPMEVEPQARAPRMSMIF